MRRLVLLISFLIAAVAAPSAAQAADYYLGHHAPGPAKAKKNSVVVLIHGGGWRGDLRTFADPLMHTYIADLTRWGHRVYNVGYRSGAKSLPDVRDAIDRVARTHRKAPICLVGESAGAHLALVAAKRSKRIKCVIDIAGPPDLLDSGNRPHAKRLTDLATWAFGEQRLRRLSPINRVRGLRNSAVLIAAAPCDVYIDIAQQRRFARKLRKGRLVELDPGREVSMAHCQITLDSRDELRRVSRNFLARQLRR